MMPGTQALSSTVEQIPIPRSNYCAKWRDGLSLSLSGKLVFRVDIANRMGKIANGDAIDCQVSPRLKQHFIKRHLD